MSIEDYVLNLILIALVVLQMRGKRLTPVGLLWPLAIVVGAGVKYLGNIPTGALDLAIVVGGGVAGGVLGGLCGLTTQVFRRGDVVVAKATGTAAVLWIAGVGARVAFVFWATHGGGAAITRWSTSHSIDGIQTWTACLVLMALAEVLGRTVALAWRGQRVRRCIRADAEAVAEESSTAGARS